MDCLNDLIHERGKLGQAWFSADRAHRYLLLRGGDIDDSHDEKPLVVFIMLNPSTADADQNDPTIAKCIKFAARFMGRPHRVAIVNLFAIRATDPDVAFAHPAPRGGIKNDEVILATARKADTIIAAWGADKRSTSRAREVSDLIREYRVVKRLGPASKEGHPRHPLYLRDATELETHAW